MAIIGFIIGNPIITMINHACPKHNHDIVEIIYSNGSLYWKQLENKQVMKASRLMKWNNCIN
jgi:hypothetical protein